MPCLTHFQKLVILFSEHTPAPGPLLLHIVSAIKKYAMDNGDVCHIGIMLQEQSHLDQSLQTRGESLM